MDLSFIPQPIIDNILELLKFSQQEPMIFSSGIFLFLFAGFTLIYGLLRNLTTLRILYVIAFSLYFYYKSSGIYLWLLILASASDYTIAHYLNATSRVGWRKFWVFVSVIINLGMLGYFKYTNFFIDITNSIAGSQLLDFQNIFLPVGVSFFVFQSLSYTIDVYRHKIKPLNRWIDYLFYLSFFPQLVAGPIVRASDFIPQIHKRVFVSKEMFGEAIFLIITGLFKKAVISDYISLNFVDRVFDEPLLYTGVEALMAIYGYALQIYCDFSGYSDMAIGLALLLGFRFPANFNAPYKSATITEFWRRWHISLSSWLRDYLYISLGGNRKGKVRTYLNLMITMLLGGLWHGAAVRFILWGGLHGVALALHKLWMTIFPSAKESGKDMNIVMRVLGIFITFHIVCLGWLLFRADSMEVVRDMLSQIAFNFDPALTQQVVFGYKEVCILLALGYILHLLPHSLSDKFREFITSSHIVLQVAYIALAIWLVMQVKSSDIQPFIYFQF